MTTVRGACALAKQKQNARTRSQKRVFNESTVREMRSTCLRKDVRGEARTRGEERGRRVSGKGGRGGEGAMGHTDRLRHPSLACSSGSSSTAPSTFATSMKHAAGMRLARRRTGAKRGGVRVRRRDGWARSGSRSLCHRRLNPKTEKRAEPAIAASLCLCPQRNKGCAVHGMPKHSRGCTRPGQALYRP